MNCEDIPDSQSIVLPSQRCQIFNNYRIFLKNVPLCTMYTLMDHAMVKLCVFLQYPWSMVTQYRHRWSWATSECTVVVGFTVALRQFNSHFKQLGQHPTISHLAALLWLVIDPSSSTHMLSRANAPWQYFQKMNCKPSHILILCTLIGSLVQQPEHFSPHLTLSSTAHWLTSVTSP